ncbi:MAG TPA: hypothetical protein VEX70_16090 [Pyrinomonadaceae bacterium]|jgi:hypothetical protein|nr:hypothetical protein [Pyrinomonadaceae bacterium]
MSSEDNQESVHLVLRSGVTRELFEETAAELGLTKQGTWEPKGEKEAYEQVWTTPDMMRAINYVEDPFTGMNYVHFRGSDLEELIEDFTDKLATYGPGELVERAYTTDEHDEYVHNLYRLAITFAEYDQEVFVIFENVATEAPHPKLRLAALDALAFRRWPQSRAVVERVGREDDDEGVKGAAQRLLTLWDAPPPEQRT